MGYQYEYTCTAEYVVCVVSGTWVRRCVLSTIECWLHTSKSKANQRKQQCSSTAVVQARHQGKWHWCPCTSTAYPPSAGMLCFGALSALSHQARVECSGCATDIYDWYDITYHSVTKYKNVCIEVSELMIIIFWDRVPNFLLIVLSLFCFSHIITAVLVRTYAAVNNDCSAQFELGLLTVCNTALARQLHSPSAATMKSKKDTSPTFDAGEFGCTPSTRYPHLPCSAACALPIL